MSWETVGRACGPCEPDAGDSHRTDTGTRITKVTGNVTIVLGKKFAATGIDALPCRC
jgi:hypothetical protein